MGARHALDPVLDPVLGTPPATAAATLPAGTRLRADPSLEWLGTSLVAGGSPWRLVRLHALGAAQLASWCAGEPLGADPAGTRLARRLVEGGLVHPDPAARDASGEVDVVVPVRDGAHDLDALLATLGACASVTVVDDGSAEPGVVAAVAARHGAALVRRDAPGGPASARNAGLGVTTSPVVAFVDVDVRCGPTWLDELVGCFDDPLVAAVAPRVRGPSGRGARDRFEAAASPLDLGSRPGVVRPGAAVPFVPSAALLVRRDAVGTGFDESLRTGEDVDLVWRLVAAGWQVRYEPRVAVTHAARDSWRGWAAQRFAYGLSAAPLEARHGDDAAPLRGDVRVLATLGLVLAGRPRAAAAVLSWSAASLARRLDEVLPDARRDARRLAARGTALAAPGLARSAFRSYGPLLCAAAVLVPPLRRPVAAVALTATATRWVRAGRPRGVLGFAALSVADDLLYGAGVLAGAVRARRTGALRPRLGPLVARRPGLSRT